jgi:DHA2 family multidrug resistance protein
LVFGVLAVRLVLGIPRIQETLNTIGSVSGQATNMNSTTIKPLFGLLGVLVAAISADLNEFVSAAALIDVRGALAISTDTGRWIDSLYITGSALGMPFAPWNAVTFTLRRFTLFAIGVACTATTLLAVAPNLHAILILRLIQGLSGGLTIPLLMTTALHVLAPSIRLYGLAIYALTITFTPNISISFVAIWVDVVQDWHLVFLQAIPLDAVAAVLVWYGLPQDMPRYERLLQFDWRGALLVVVGVGSLTTLLLHGDHEDWFNSPTISLLALASAVAFPLLVLNEWFHPLPLLKLQMLGRRNLVYGLIALVLFVTISLTSSVVPQEYLVEIQGYRPLQEQALDLLLSLGQFALLPAVAFLLDHEWVDARAVMLGGLGLLLAACLGCAQIDASWIRDQFRFWQHLQMVGQPMIAVSLLMMMTNTLKGPEEGPFASALVNSTRGLADAVGTWFLELVTRWRGALHSDRLVDQVGQNWFRTIEAPTLLPRDPAPLLPNGQPGATGSLQQFAHMIELQVSVLTRADTFLLMAALCGISMFVTLVLPVRTYPPRILLTKKR